jgi:hypothetical protein
MQLEFPWRDESTLQHELESVSGFRLDLTLTNNTSTMMSLKRSRVEKKARLRLHRMFLTANAQVIRALATWLRRNRCSRSSTVINEFIKENKHQIDHHSPHHGVRGKDGRLRDLSALYRAINRKFFDNEVDAQILWGRMPSRRARNSIRFGSYSQEENLIRIHPFLDDPFVPEFFVRYIVFHEMLHAHLGVGESPDGRRRIHTREFKRREKAYPEYERAVSWLSDPANLHHMLRSRKKNSGA